MILCPKCGSDSRTTGYRKYKEENNLYSRGRKCINCGYRFKTIEIEECKLDRAIELEKTLSDLVEKMLKNRVEES